MDGAELLNTEMLGFHPSYPYTPSLDPHSLAQKRRPPVTQPTQWALDTPCLSLRLGCVSPHSVWAHRLTLNALLSGLLQEAGSDAQAKFLSSSPWGWLPASELPTPAKSKFTSNFLSSFKSQIERFLRASPLVDAPCRADILPLSS